MARQRVLKFDDPEFHALNRIPPEIAELERLVRLNLSNTQISDISPLAGLKNLERLYLTKTKVESIAPLINMDALYDLLIDETKVSDLRPLLYLKAMHSNPAIRLSFQAIPATELDLKLNEASTNGSYRNRFDLAVEHLRKLPPWHPLDEKLPELIAQMNALSGKVLTLEGHLIPPSAIPRLSQDVQNLKEAVLASMDSIEHSLKQAAALDAATTGIEKRLERLWALQEQRAQTVADGFNEAIERATATFREQNKLKAPVTLWDDKMKEHRTSKRWGMGLFLLSLLVIVAAALSVLFTILLWPEKIDQLFAPVGCDLATGTNCSGFSMKGLVVTAAVLTFFTILLWFARLQMKLYLAERHLALDARERRAFSETYVGLLAEGDTSREATEQRSLVYAALFRPSADGTVREEGGIDPAISAALSKLLTK